VAISGKNIFVIIAMFRMLKLPSIGVLMLMIGATPATIDFVSMILHSDMNVVMYATECFALNHAK
jgi:hypothetical protein